jgi:hypothetical protein
MTAGLRLIALLAVLILLVACLGCPQRGAPEVTQVSPPAGPTGAAAPPAAAGSAPPQVAELQVKRAAVTSYAMTMTIDKNPPMTHLMKFDNGKLTRLRMDMSGMGGGEGYILVEKDQNVTYMVNPKDKTAMKMPEAKGGNMMGGDETTNPALPNLQDLAASAWTQETVDKVPCWKVETTDQQGAKATVWIDRQYGLARQFQSGGKLIKETYDKINAVPDSDFELPPGTTVTKGTPGMPGGGSMPNMPGAGQMPNMPAGHDMPPG